MTETWSETFTHGHDRVVVTYSVSTQSVLAERYRGDELVEVTADSDRVKSWARGVCGEAWSSDEAHDGGG